MVARKHTLYTTNNITMSKFQPKFERYVTKKMLLINFLQLLIYSSSHIVQITDFVDFLHEYCEEKSEIFTEF